MKKPKRITVILYGLCMALWTVRAIVAIIFREYENSVFIFVVNILCAVVWIAAFVKQLITYRSCFDEQEQETKGR